MDILRKRKRSLVAGVIIEVLVGINYAYSVFQQPLMDKFGWSIKQAAFGYTVYYIMVLFSSFFLSEKLRKKLDIRSLVLLGALFYSGGIILMYFMKGSPLELYLFFGVFTSIGCVMVSPSITAYAMKLFPEKPGFAGGCTTAGYGVGAVLWAPLVTIIAEMTGDIKNAFLYLGILFLISIILLSRGLYEISTEEQGVLQKQKEVEFDKILNQEGSLFEVEKKQMMKLAVFYLMMISLTIVFVCGTMVITQAAPMLQEMFSVSATDAAVVVSLCAVSNTIGRSIWGGVSDKIGQAKVLLYMHVSMIIIMAILLFAKNIVLFKIALICATFCYGGSSSLVAPMTRKLFGEKNIDANYAVTFCSFGISGILGSYLISTIRQYTESYSYGFVFGLILSVIALICTYYIHLTVIKHEDVKK